MIEDCTALILAGGESQRMGQDKACLLFSGMTLLEKIASVLQPLFANIIVSTKDSRPTCGLPQILDHPAHKGPLAGLLAGLEHASTSWVFAVGCDMPFIVPGLIEYLAGLREGCDAIVPVVSNHPQPMAAFYSRRSLDTLHDLMSDGASHSMREFLDRISVRYVNEEELKEYDPMLTTFFDLDTPQDIALAQNMRSL
jgi:molybdenum cofactor guanylyltransferase